MADTVWFIFQDTQHTALIQTGINKAVVRYPFMTHALYSLHQGDRL